MALTKQETKFLKDMIPHHKIAITEAEKVLKDAKDPFVKSLANAIIKAQKKEIADMTKRLEEDGQNATGGSATHGGSSGGSAGHAGMAKGLIDWGGAFVPKSNEE